MHRLCLPANPWPPHASEAMPTVTASEGQAALRLSWEAQHPQPGPIFPSATNENKSEDFDIIALIPHCSDGETETQTGTAAAPDHLARWHQELPDPHFSFLQHSKAC